MNALECYFVPPIWIGPSKSVFSDRLTFISANILQRQKQIEIW
jgi:hypothetical protein